MGCLLRSSIIPILIFDLARESDSLVGSANGQIILAKLGWVWMCSLAPGLELVWCMRSIYLMRSETM